MTIRKAASLAFVVIALVVGVLLFFVWSPYDPADSPDSPRWRASVVLLTLSQQKSAVEEYVRVSGKLDGADRVISLNPAPEAYLGKIFVFDHASMIGVDSRNEFTVFLEPSLEGKTIRWECTVIPPRASPAPCRKP